MKVIKRISLSNGRHPHLVPPLVLFLLVVSLLIQPSTLSHSGFRVSAAVTSHSNEAWPTFHHDVARTGYTSDQAPTSPRILWSYQTGAPIESSPVIANGTVYFGSDDGYLYAVNGSTGSLFWRAQIGAGGLGSPAVYGDSVYAGGFAGGRHLYRLNAFTGIEVWNASVGSVDLSILPVNGRICSGQFGVNGVAGPGSGVYCLNARNGSKLWFFKVTFPTELAYADGLIYTSSGYYGSIHALNVTVGSVAWEYNKTSEIVTGGPTVFAGVLYAGGAVSGPGPYEFFALNASTGSVIWRTNTTTNGPPAVAEGVLIYNGGSGVVGLNRTDGSRMWGFNFHSFGVSLSVPAVGGDLAIVGGGVRGAGFADPTIYALNVKTGNLVWSLPVGVAANGSPAISGGVVYVGADDGKLYAITNAGISFLSWPTFGYIVVPAVGFFLAITILLRTRRRRRIMPQEDPHLSNNASSWPKLAIDLVNRPTEHP